MTKKILYPIVKNPEKIKIGVTAPSSGLGTDVFNKRFDLVKKQHEEIGIEIIEGSCLRDQNNSASAPAKDRAA